MPRAGRTTALILCEDATASRRRRPSSDALCMWCSIILIAILRMDHSLVIADCWYESELHAEGAGVRTHEPCLNCTCSRGVLLCYLRVCPRLPNPPPSGCILLHRFKACCPELICADIPAGNSIEARSDTHLLEDFPNERMGSHKHACLVNGSVYAPGSAMDSSSECEFCFCLAGIEQCIRPKCLLPLEGCVPAYQSNDCCPARYNCSRDLYKTSTTTTASPKEYDDQMGCVVDGHFHPEGRKIVGIGYSICDNCYCLRGLVRCEPLSCASPLLGCTPVIRPGECCAASYNCSGAIETRPEANYGHFPTVSKEYAKLRKEVQHKRTTSVKFRERPTDDTREPYYVIAESQQDTSTATTTPTPFHYNLMASKEPAPDIFYVPADMVGAFRSDYENLQDGPDIYREHSVGTTVRHKKFTSQQDGETVQQGLEERVIRGVVHEFEENSTASVTEEEMTSTVESTTQEVGEDSTTFESPAESTPMLELVELITLRTVSNSTDCTTFPNKTIDVRNSLENLELDDDSGSATTELSTSTLDKAIDPSENSTPYGIDNDLESSWSSDEIEGTTKLAGSDLHDTEIIPLIKKITLGTILKLNEGNQSVDYDYNDYTAPTLPPSLPNLRIIPFVAADALDTSKDNAKLKNTYTPEESFPFANRFSPPAETEGGFVPKEPPIISERFYEDYRTTNGGTNMVSSAPPLPALTSPPKSDENNCVLDGKEIKHGESVSSEGSCALCVCFFGGIVCHEPQCPLPKKGCRNGHSVDRETCCPRIVCDDESPTFVLDRLLESPVTSNPKQILPSSEDPFKDVIRTEAPPDLQLLIGDMSKHLTTTMTSSTTTLTSVNVTNATEDRHQLSFNMLWDMLFHNDEPKSSTTNNPLLPGRQNLVETRENVAESSFTTKRAPSDVPALLKLAGCNIYGRMYRVGRIISELSGPCLECKCTEVGVQCENLKC